MSSKVKIKNHLILKMMINRIKFMNKYIEPLNAL